MKRLALLLVMLAFWTWPVLAQDTPTISNLEIALWPEFDRPEVLVIYRGLLDAETPVPVPLEIRIPARVGEPTAVAYVGEGGQRFNLENTTRVEGDWLVVSFDLPTSGFQLEYYDTLDINSEGERQYTFPYTADYDIEALDLQFQVPPTAEGFTLDPPTDMVASEADGLTYHTVQAGPVGKGDNRAWSFAYQKANSDLTVSSLEQSEVAAPDAGAALAPTTAGNDNSTVLLFLVAFVALIGVGAGTFWLGRRTQTDTETAPVSARRPKRRGSGRGLEDQSLVGSSSSSESMFCYKCGARLRSDSDFCHRCGAVVREG